MIKQLFSIGIALSLFSQMLWAQWTPVGDRIKTSWAEKIDVNNVLPEYPRPIMERSEWSNLNGLWKYAVLPLGKSIPDSFEGDILVPFAVESSLSGVGRTLGEDKELWYQREFVIPSKWRGKRILLHFGAVDWKTEVWVNNIKVGEHTGGFTPFTFDITQALKNSENNLVVKVWDPTEKGTQPRGKQVSNPHGIWYTPVSGIWQTVWLEPVSEHYITDIKTTPDIDLNKVKVKVETDDNRYSDKFEVKVFEGGRLVAVGTSINGLPVEVSMPADAKLWSPDEPFLYQMEVSLFEGGKRVDCVRSYMAMRKYSMKRDKKGIVRLQLNNKDLFQFGPLDQGWWPDGLYTAPTDEALCYDIKKTKDLGFNMIRKHVKVEPARWYTYCDQMGVIVWQDMPNGDKTLEWQRKKYFDGTELARSPESEATYRKEWKEIINYLYSYPCIGTWVPFNEAWGQFKTSEIAEWTKQYDPTRLVNPASGGNHYTCGDMLDLHNYPGPEMYLYDAQRATVLGEYGGIGLVLKNHLWEPNRNWGYIQFNTSTEATAEYLKYAEKHFPIIERAVQYDQAFDVVYGNAGAILALINLYSLKRDKRYLNCAKTAAKVICDAQQKGGGWKAATVSAPLAGFSHGVAGIVYALNKLYKLYPDKHIKQCIVNGLQYEDELFCEADGNWKDIRKGSTNGKNLCAWCHGAGGILLSRISLLGNIDNETDEIVKEDIRNAVKTMQSHKYLQNPCVCHGIAGNAEILLTYGQQFQDQIASSTAKHFYSRLVGSVNSGTFECSRPYLYGFNIPGFMTGLAGIGYSLLRLLDPTLPSVLQINI